jgi:hypothetical protein
VTPNKGSKKVSQAYEPQIEKFSKLRPAYVRHTSLNRGLLQAQTRVQPLLRRRSDLHVQAKTDLDFSLFTDIKERKVPTVRVEGQVLVASVHSTFGLRPSL